MYDEPSREFVINRSLGMSRRCTPKAVWTVVLVAASASTALCQTQGPPVRSVPTLRAPDLVALQKQCATAEPQTESFALMERCLTYGSAAGRPRVVAFEENAAFIYALATVRGQRRPARDGDLTTRRPRRTRKVFFLKPSTILVEDVVRARGSRRSIPWRLTSSGKPRVEGRRVRLAEGDSALLCELLLHEKAPLSVSTLPAGDDGAFRHRVEITAEPESGAARFLAVIHVGAAAEKDPHEGARVDKAEDGAHEITVTTEGHVFRIGLPGDSSRAGEIEIAGTSGNAILPRRLLPSGVMPHGPEGTRLLERWDAPYRQDRAPGWDVGRPSSHLVAAVRDGNLPKGRAIVFGCGTGTNAIYLASQGYDVTAIDVAPTALHLARQKAREADVTVRWMVADVLALPEMQPFDLIFDRGCYHHVRQYDAGGYVKTVYRLSHPGSRALILAGSDKRQGGGGPPKVKESEIRGDFSELFEIERLQEIRFDRRDPNGNGAPARSVLLRRRAE